MKNFLRLLSSKITFGSRYLKSPYYMSLTLSMFTISKGSCLIGWSSIFFYFNLKIQFFKVKGGSFIASPRARTTEPQNPRGKHNQYTQPETQGLIKPLIFMNPKRDTVLVLPTLHLRLKTNVAISPIKSPRLAKI